MVFCLLVTAIDFAKNKRLVQPHFFAICPLVIAIFFVVFFAGEKCGYLFLGTAIDDVKKNFPA